MKKIVILIVLGSIPLLLMLQVWQNYRYRQALDAAVLLEEQQREAQQRNHRLLAGIAVYSAPARVERIAREELDLQRPLPEDVTQVTFLEAEEGGP